MQNGLAKEKDRKEEIICRISRDLILKSLLIVGNQVAKNIRPIGHGRRLQPERWLLRRCCRPRRSISRWSSAAAVSTICPPQQPKDFLLWSSFSDINSDCTITTIACLPKYHWERSSPHFWLSLFFLRLLCLAFNYSASQQQQQRQTIHQTSSQSLLALSFFFIFSTSAQLLQLCILLFFIQCLFAAFKLDLFFCLLFKQI